ncbi:MAG: helix-turn-helix domain-containing protein [Pseudonocardiaceae bacterium]
MVGRAELDRSWVELGRRLAASRRAARLSQSALGGLIGCVRSTVSHIERARRRSDRTFWRLADQHCRTDGGLLAMFDALVAAEVDYRARCEVQPGPGGAGPVDGAARTGWTTRRPGRSEYSGGGHGPRRER